MIINNIKVGSEININDKIWKFCIKDNESEILNNKINKICFEKEEIEKEKKKSFENIKENYDKRNNNLYESKEILWDKNINKDRCFSIDNIEFLNEINFLNINKNPSFVFSPVNHVNFYF